MKIVDSEVKGGLNIVLFNTKTYQTRKILLKPNRNWGGKGLIGCEFGTGILNCLPQINLNLEGDEMNTQLENILSLKEKI